MPSATAVSVLYAILTVFVAGAWVAGYLDRFQKILQNALLGAMGDNRMSYGLKSTIKNQEISDDKDFKNLQGGVADSVGGLMGKGGIGESIGSTVSESL